MNCKGMASGIHEHSIQPLPPISQWLREAWILVGQWTNSATTRYKQYKQLLYHKHRMNTTQATALSSTRDWHDTEHALTETAFCHQETQHSISVCKDKTASSLCCMLRKPATWPSKRSVKVFREPKTYTNVHSHKNEGPAQEHTALLWFSNNNVTLTTDADSRSSVRKDEQSHLICSEWPNIDAYSWFAMRPRRKWVSTATR